MSDECATSERTDLAQDVDSNLAELLLNRLLDRIRHGVRLDKHCAQRRQRFGWLSVCVVVGQTSHVQE
jgi:hypothetical protein